MPYNFKAINYKIEYQISNRGGKPLQMTKQMTKLKDKIKATIIYKKQINKL